MPKELRVRDDDTFVIVQLSDIEFIDAIDEDPETPQLDQQTR